MSDASSGITKDRPLNRQEAAAFQEEVRDAGYLLIWTVMTGTSDFGNRYICRPQIVGENLNVWVLRVLIADDLKGLRAQLPPGLSVIQRCPTDDPVIVEIWM